MPASEAVVARYRVQMPGAGIISLIFCRCLITIFRLAHQESRTGQQYFINNFYLYTTQTTPAVQYLPRTAGATIRSLDYS